MYGREQSIGFQYTSPPSSFVPVSSPPTGPLHMAGPSRRPLPTPRTRPESMPPSVRESTLVVQSPAPSRPAILAPSATLPTSPTARRPLPTPALPLARPSTKHASIDLTGRPASPVKSSSPSHPTLGRGPTSKRGLPPPPSPSNPTRTNGLSCGGCNGPIVGRIVSAMGQRWHPNCFKCTICNELLEHVSSYEHDGRPYCHLDYHETFAPRCFHCKTAIIDERFITLDDPALGKRTYHEQHFFCAECGDPFLAPSAPLPPSAARTGELNFSGDGEFVDDDVGFTVYRGHPYCEACHVRLRMPKCQACKKSIRDGVRAVEALGGKWCWGCFVCEGCKNPFEDPSFFLRNDKPFCEPCFSLILRNEV
ncbi:LIM-domain-containing protein [Imleria badia]|nr:LIM-domain-containing protein [Imleria badia]